MKSIQSVEGTTLRIQSTSGQVTLRDASGKEIKANDQLLLHEGYVLTTAKGEVYINVDNKDVVKLGASGQVKVAKAGSRLKVTLVSGELQSGASAKTFSHVQTANMATGIRG